MPHGFLLTCYSDSLSLLPVQREGEIGGYDGFIIECRKALCQEEKNEKHFYIIKTIGKFSCCALLCPK
jgi:hypothetical protein